MSKKEFVAAMLHPEYETFIVYIASLSFAVSLSSTLLNAVHPSRKPQIANSIAKKTFIKVPDKYVNFTDVFFLDLASKFLQQTKINNHTIKLVDSQQLSYWPIYSLEPVELETLKVYIKINLTNRFIRPFKLLAGAPIFFDQKSDSFFQLYVNYRGLNNLIIKNRYLLLLVGELLNRLKKARQFTQLYLTSIYYQIRSCKKNE